MPIDSPRAWALPALALVAGIAGLSAIWVALATLSGSTCAWMGLVSALDLALLLRLTQAPPGRTRVALAVLASAVTLVLAQWMLVANQLAEMGGLTPWQSAFRVGPQLAWQLATLGLGRVDAVLLLASLPLAAILVQAPRRPD